MFTISSFHTTIALAFKHSKNNVFYSPLKRKIYHSVITPMVTQVEDAIRFRKFVLSFNMHQECEDSKEKVNASFLEKVKKDIEFKNFLIQANGLIEKQKKKDAFVIDDGID